MLKGEIDSLGILCMYFVSFNQFQLRPHLCKESLHFTSRPAENTCKHSHTDRLEAFFQTDEIPGANLFLPNH